MKQSLLHASDWTLLSEIFDESYILCYVILISLVVVVFAALGILPRVEVQWICGI